MLSIGTHWKGLSAAALACQKRLCFRQAASLIPDPLCIFFMSSVNGLQDLPFYGQLGHDEASSMTRFFPSRLLRLTIAIIIVWTLSAGWPA